MHRPLGPFPPTGQEYSMKQAERDVLEAHVETQKQRIAELQEELAQARAQEQILNARIEQLEKQAQGAAWCGVAPSIEEVRAAFEEWTDENFQGQTPGRDAHEYTLIKKAYIAAARRFGGVK